MFIHNYVDMYIVRSTYVPSYTTNLKYEYARMYVGMYIICIFFTYNYICSTYVQIFANFEGKMTNVTYYIWVPTSTYTSR